jgi:hypothetical protein
MKWVKENWWKFRGFLMLIISIILMILMWKTTFVLKQEDVEEKISISADDSTKYEINFITYINIDATDTICPFLGSDYKKHKIKAQHDMIIEIDSIFPKWMDTLVIVKHSTGDTIKVALNEKWVGDETRVANPLDSTECDNLLTHEHIDWADIHSVEVELFVNKYGHSSNRGTGFSALDSLIYHKDLLINYCTDDWFDTITIVRCKTDTTLIILGEMGWRIYEK